ncbi:MAG: hypothetical protein IJ146_14905 [Kiritimatiellae bacterium]|jgi:hypothetical protein|nr:hypothetical protein [Kiritimatiellia bacterium]
MKKLIALAAIVAAGAAFGACEYIPKDTAWVYKWKFTGKTTFGTKPASVKAAPAGLCGFNGQTTTGAPTCVVRTPSSLKIEGYTWVCKPGCGSDAFEQFVEANEIFWQKKPFKASLAGGVATDVSNIIGKKAKQFEAAGTATFTEFINGGAVKEGTYTLTYAGFGKYDQKNSRVKCVKGNFAGYLDQPHYISAKDCTNAGYWDCETMALECTGTSVAFGKWSAKFKKSASKKYLNGGRLPKIPSWVVAMNAQ